MRQIYKIIVRVANKRNTSQRKDELYKKEILSKLFHTKLDYLPKKSYI